MFRNIVLRSVRIASCLERMKGSHLVPITVVIVISRMQHWVLAIWCLRRTRLSIGGIDSVTLKVSFMCSSAFDNSIVILNNSPRISLDCQIELWQSSSFTRSIVLTRHAHQWFFARLLVSQNMYTFTGEEWSSNASSTFNFQKHIYGCRILAACLTGSMHSSITHIVAQGRC